MKQKFRTKADARQRVWDDLDVQRFARPPFPAHGRIPNFEGADLAALKIFESSPWREASAIKVNPDSPQMHVRLHALTLGIRVYVPTPGLKGGFHLLDPERIPPSCFRQAATLSSMPQWSQAVALDELPQLDAIVTGCVAVTARGKRAGKGAGYSDIEYAILRELGHKPVPVATTVHEIQIVEDFPIETNDLPLSLICTPMRTLRVASPLPAPMGIQWSRLTPEDIRGMPLLGDLDALQEKSGQ